MSKRGPDRSSQGSLNKRRSHGKPMLKMLCPYYCAGAIIGKGGETIKELMDKTDCDVKISKNDERFPTTSERVISVQGDQSAVEECILFCQDKIRKDQPPPNAKSESHAINAKRKEACKIVVSDTSAGRIIGKGGQRIKDMKNDYSVDINITRKDELPRGFDERCVSVEGEAGNVDNCVKEVIKLVCEDESASMEWHVFYNDWNERGGGRGGDRDGGRDYRGRDNFGGGRDFGGDRFGGDRFDRGGDDRRGGGGFDRDGGRGYDDRRGFNDRDGGYGGRDSYGGARDSGRDGGGRGDDYGRDSYRSDGPRDGGRDYRDGDRGAAGAYEDRGYGGARDSYGGRDNYTSGGAGGRDSYNDRDRYTSSAVGRDSSYRAEPYSNDRRDDFGARGGTDSYARTDSFGGGRDGSYGRDPPRDASRNMGYNDRRDVSYRDEPRGGGGRY